MATAEAGEGRDVQQPGLGPRTRRSTATRGMAAAAGGGGEEEERRRLYILGLPVSVPLPVAISLLDAGVPRKARTSRPRAKPSGWWAFRLPVPLPKEEGRRAAPVPPKETRSPHPQRMRVLCLEAPSRADLDAAAMERPAKKARRCVQCGSAETPQWRSGPMGRSTLCNACGVRLRAAGALRETEHSPPPATPGKVAEKPPPPPPPESPVSDSPPDSPICERRAPPGDIYLVRKQPKREKRTPRKEAAAPVSSSPAIYLVKKKKPSKKPWRPRNMGQKCLHCGTTSTPQWREGPMGRHTLCNACGVRYRQGRLLPEYRPAASPTFVPSEHASRHREVLQLHRQQQQQSKKPHRKQQPKPIDEDSPLLDRFLGGTGDLADAAHLESDGDDKNNVFLIRRQPPDQYPPTPLHRPLPQPDDPRVGNNGLTAGAVAGCGGGDDKTGVLGSTAGCSGGNDQTGLPGSAAAGSGNDQTGLRSSAGAGDDKTGVLGSTARCGGGNDQTGVPGSAAGCGVGGDDALDSLLLDGPSAPLIVDSNEFVVS